MSRRQQHAPPEFKAKVALEALKGEETALERASRFACIYHRQAMQGSAERRQ